jgi:hypothetical protein
MSAIRIGARVRSVLVLLFSLIFMTMFQNCSGVGFEESTSVAGKSLAMNEVEEDEGDEDEAEEDDAEEDGLVCIGNGIKVKASNIVDCTQAGLGKQSNGNRCVYLCQNRETKVVTSKQARSLLKSTAVEGQCQ